MTKTTIMKLSALFAASLLTAGCYTKLMTPQEFVQTQRYQVKKTYSDNSYSLNYNQSCVTCHSTGELNERYDELSQQGVMSVHNGIPFDPSRWENTSIADQPVIYIPYPDPYWPGPASPVNPWWAPPVSTTGGSAASDNKNKIRENGSTRDVNRTGEREAPISTPVYSQPQTSGSTPAPMPSAPPPTVNSTPAPQPAPTNSGERSRDSNSSSGSTDRTRDNGSSRDSGGSRPR